MNVTTWHINELAAIGFKLMATHEIKTPRQKNGANANLRVGFESILVLENDT